MGLGGCVCMPGCLGEDAHVCGVGIYVGRWVSWLVMCTHMCVCVFVCVHMCVCVCVCVSERYKSMCVFFFNLLYLCCHTFVFYIIE